MKECLGYLAWGVVGLVISFLVLGFFVLMAWSVYQLDVYRCSQKYPDFERRQGGFYARCLIKVDGKWIPAENYLRQETK